MSVTKEQREQAKEFGRIAFAKGQKCVPALDKNYLSMLEGRPVGGGGAKLAQAWIIGWTDANLRADYLVEMGA